MGLYNPNFQHEDLLDQDVCVIHWQYGVYIFYWSEMLWKRSKPKFQICTTAVLNSKNLVNKNTLASNLRWHVVQTM